MERVRHLRLSHDAHAQLGIFVAISRGQRAGILAYIDSYPLWAQVGWGLGVWGGVLGSLLLLARSRFAAHAFAVSLLGIILSFGYQYFGGAGMPAGMEEGAHNYMPLVIALIAIGLLLFARAMRRRGLLR